MLDRTVAPPYRQIDHISIKQPERYTVGSGGIELYTIEAGTQPVIKLELIFEVGNWDSKKPAIPLFSGKILREGAGILHSVDISTLFASYGAQLEINYTLDYIFITIYSLEKYLVNLLPVVKSMIQEPTFPPDELETLKNIQLQTLRVNKEKNSFLASRKLRESLYGSTHPYGHILEETDIHSINRSDIKEYYQSSILHKPFKIIASGKFGEDSIKKIAETFGDILIQNQVLPRNYKPGSYRKSIAIDKEDSSQSSIRLGCLSIPMEHPDYPQLLVANEILGGYFGSRLMKNIREEKGLTYGIYSSLSSLKHGSFFSVSADIKKDFKDSAFTEILAEIGKLGKEPVPNEELNTVRNYMLGQLQASISTPFSLATKFKNVHLKGLGYDFYDNLIYTIKSISSEQIILIASKYLSEESMARVRVG